MTLRINSLSGFGGGGGAVKIVGSVAGNTFATSQATHPLGNIDVGSASGDKNIILGITWTSQSARTVSTLTVGGVALTERITAHHAGSDDSDASIFTGDISSISGSQAISCTFSDGVQASAVSAIAVERLQSLVPDNSDGDTTGTVLTITNLAAPAGGIAFAVACSSAHDTTTTWGALTERADVSTGGSSSDDQVHSSAWDLGFRAAANETITFGSAATSAGVGAGFR